MAEQLSASAIAAIAGRGLALKVAKKGASITIGAWSAREELKRRYNRPDASKPLPRAITYFDKPRAASALAGFGLAAGGIAMDVAKHTQWGTNVGRAIVSAAGNTRYGKALKLAAVAASITPTAVMKAGFLLGAPNYDALGREVVRHYEGKGWDKGLGPAWKHAFAIEHLPFQDSVSKLPGMGWYKVDALKHREHGPPGWLDTKNSVTRLTPKEMAAAAAIITVPPAVAGLAIGYAEKAMARKEANMSEFKLDPEKIAKAKLDTARAQISIAKATGSRKWANEASRHVADVEKMTESALKQRGVSVLKPKQSRQIAPRYKDNIKSPRAQIATYKRAIAHAKSDPVFAGQLPHLEKQLKGLQRAEKMVSTKVAKGQLNAFQAHRVGGRFASPTLAARVSRMLPTAGRALSIASGVVTVGSLGLVGYNLITGKHAGDREEAMKRDNDPGRLATSGIVGTAATGLTNRLLAGVAARTATGLAARALGPLAIGGLASYGAYKGYAEEGVKGAVRGAVSSLTMGLADGVMNKVLGEKKVDNIGPYLKGRWPRFSERSEGFNKANAEHRTQHAGPSEAHEYKDTWTDKRGRNYVRRDMSVRKEA